MEDDEDSLPKRNLEQSDIAAFSVLETDRSNSDPVGSESAVVANCDELGVGVEVLLPVNEMEGKEPAVVEVVVPPITDGEEKGDEVVSRRIANAIEVVEKGEGAEGERVAVSRDMELGSKSFIPDEEKNGAEVACLGTGIQIQRREEEGFAEVHDLPFSSEPFHMVKDDGAGAEMVAVEKISVGETRIEAEIEGGVQQPVAAKEEEENVVAGAHGIVYEEQIVVAETKTEIETEGSAELPVVADEEQENLDTGEKIPSADDKVESETEGSAEMRIAEKDGEVKNVAAEQRTLVDDTKLGLQVVGEVAGEEGRELQMEAQEEKECNGALVEKEPPVEAQEEKESMEALVEKELPMEAQEEKDNTEAHVGKEPMDDKSWQNESFNKLPLSAENDEEEAIAEVGRAEGKEDEEMVEATNNFGKDSLNFAAEDEDEDAMGGEEDVEGADVNMETETELPDSGRVSGGKRKRGKVVKTPTKSPATRKMIEEDVCFICFDGGALVLCDRRNCPKAYHPSCVNRDEAFFQAKGRWNCGWHQCSICEKSAFYMCYTCTFSLCKGCIKNAVIFCVRKNMGFCETCMKTVMLIEKNELQKNKEDHMDFDDKSSWEYLFKDYWTDLKAKLSLSAAELSEAKNPWKGSEFTRKQDFAVGKFVVKEDGGSGPDNTSENLQTNKNRRKKPKKKSKSMTREDGPEAVTIRSEGSFPGNSIEWASKELLEFVMHMKNGDKSIISQFDVQALLLEYIKRNKLRDPRHKSQIVCDARLQNLFGKARVGHFEMLKLLESHFLIKEDYQMDDMQGTVVNTDINQLDDDETTEAVPKASRYKKRKMRKKRGAREPQSNRDDYAAINMHNINLIYLRRKLVEDLLEDVETFHDKVVGTFVRIRISGTNQKQDIYRLVQVIGTTKGAEPYKLGKRTTDVMLEILNLSKTEVISVDTISNQEFTEEECKRLRQSIKCGLLTRLTVGDIVDKATEVQATRVNDWLEVEVLRLSHLRDRASDMGRRKQLRECVEKIQLLKTPEERNRRLEEIPVVHSDPNMDPSFESEDESDADEKKQEIYMRPRSSGLSRTGVEPVSPGRGDFSSKESWIPTPKILAKSPELSRNLSVKNLSPIVEDASHSYEVRNENHSWKGCDEVTQQPSNLRASISDIVSEPLPRDVPAPIVESAIKVNETEKMWHYKDPKGKVQGPFSMAQLRKWSSSGYFPPDLKIWRENEKEEDGFLLSDALAGKFMIVDHKTDSQDRQNSHASDSTRTGQSSSRGWTGISVEVSEVSRSGRNDYSSLPSPTPKQSTPSPSITLHSPTPGGAQPTRAPVISSVLPDGIKDPNVIAPVSGLMPTPHDSSSTHNWATAPPPPPPDSHSSANIVQHVAGKNPHLGFQNWVTAPSQNVAPPVITSQQQNPNVPVQVPVYNQWSGAAGPLVHNPSVSYLAQVGSGFPQPEPWGTHQIPQPNTQQQPNVAWGTAPTNPNMGWVGSAPVNPNMNWGGTVQDPVVPVNANFGWVMPVVNLGNNVQVPGQMPGNVNQGWASAVPVQGYPPSHGWVSAPMQNAVVHGNGNPGWVATPTMNQAPVTGNTPPVTGNANLTTGNSNQVPGNEQQDQGQRGNNMNSQGGDSGFLHGRRNWNKQSSFGRGGGGSRDSFKPCPYYPSGRCRMGSSCRFLHN